MADSIVGNSVIGEASLAYGLEWLPY